MLRLRPHLWILGLTLLCSGCMAEPKDTPAFNRDNLQFSDAPPEVSATPQNDVRSQTQFSIANPGPVSVTQAPASR